MADYFIYASAETGYFAKISDRALDAPSLVEVDSIPPNINYKWNGSSWTALTNAEIEALVADVEPPAPGENPSEIEGGIEPETIETINQIIAPRDRQIAIEIKEETSDKTSWQQIPQMRLISKNLIKSWYTISVELLTKVSKNNRDFEFALFINGQQQLNDSLHIDFNRANNDKTLSWSNDFELEPNSIISLFWRRVGSSVKCTVGRRKLKISQHQATGLIELPPQEEQADESK